MDIKPIPSITCSKQKDQTAIFFYFSEKLIVFWCFADAVLVQELLSTVRPNLHSKCLAIGTQTQCSGETLGWNHEKAWHNGWPPMVTTGYFCHCNFIIQYWISWMGSQKDHETQVLAKNHSICLWVLTLRNSEPCWDDTFAWSSQPDWSNKGMFPANNFQALPLLANSNRGCSSSSHLWSSWTPLSHSPNHKQTHHLYHCTRGTEAAPCQHRISWKVRSEN